MIDTEELSINLLNRGITTDITLRQGKSIVELKNLEDNRTIGVASGDSIEEAIATIMRRLVDDSILLKKTMIKNRGLTVL